MTLQLGREKLKHASVIGALATVLLSVGSTPTSAQAPANPKSPREVLEAYRRMDAEGERLTPGGWYRASKYFVKPERPPLHIVMYIMDGERFTDPSRRFKENSKADDQLICSAIGQIDSLGRFTSLLSPGLAYPPRPGDQQSRGPAPIVRPYDLVLTATHWEFGPNLEGPREVKGPPEWRIETFEIEPWVTIEAAIRYLTRLRDESSSGITKRNADESIATLRRLP